MDALGRHRRNLIFLGAQAVYHHTGDSELRAAIMTTEQMRLRLPREHLASKEDIGGRGLIVRVTSVGSAGPRQVAVAVVVVVVVVVVEMQSVPDLRPVRAPLGVEVELPLGQEVSPRSGPVPPAGPSAPDLGSARADGEQMAEGVRPS